MLPVQDEAEELRTQLYRAELDLEIGLRERLQKTIEGRIQWATLLQEALTNSDNSSVSASAFKDAALEALKAIEQPSSIIFGREQPSSIQTAPLPLPPPRTRLPPPNRELPRERTQKSSRFVYIRVPKSDSDNELQPMILRCPQCLKSSFSSLQGLYNHARITHRLEWGNHEECIKATAYPMEPEQMASLDQAQEVGAASLPGVRTLFERAVEEGRTANPVKMEENTMDVDEQPSLATNHLSSTLGLHEDTPALAQFLGKEAKRREIRTQDEHVDIFLLEDGTSPAMPQNTWRMPFFARGVRSAGNEMPEQDFPMSMEELSESKPVLETASVARVPQSLLPASRFHIVSRVVVADRSFFIPPEKRTSSHTHKWMISVTSPSYSNDITTILTRIEVSNASDASQGPVLAASEPPFLVVGTASTPFLAKVVLYFVGSNERVEQTTALEHWVELDVLSRSYPVDGEEQIVDVNLDKSTILLPVKKGYEPHTSRSHWTISDDPSGAPENSERGYADLLLELLPRFPMVGKGGRAGHLPYKPCSSVEGLHELVMGRRKVLEWARARAIRDAYDSIPNKPIPLTAADVYCWLADEGHFNRPTQPQEPNAVEAPQRGTWCGVCGLLVDLHLSGSDEAFQCDIVPNILVHRKLAIQDISDLLPAREYTPAITPIEMSSFGFDARTIVRAAGDPDMVSSLRNVVKRLNLPTFQTPERLSWTETDVAPFGLLAIALKVFTKRLVQAGLEVNSRDAELAKAYGVKPKKSQRNAARLLTPVQVLSGLIDGKEKGKSSLALYGALARIGIATTSQEDPTLHGVTEGS